MLELICKKTCSTCRKAVALLDSHGAEYRYREYTVEPLTQVELKRVLALLGLTAKDVLRKNDAAYKTLGLTGTESNAALLRLMAEHPTLVQRPIGVTKTKAVLGRPVENLLALL